jgi:hypothetical protein
MRETLQTSEAMLAADGSSWTSAAVYGDRHPSLSTLVIDGSFGRREKSKSVRTTRP